MLVLEIVVLGLISGALAQTCGFTGGFTIHYANCPASAPLNCGTGLQQRCCPSTFTCVDGKYCCQSGKDCSQASEDHPQCPDSTSSVWAYNANGTLGWCCASGYYGYALLDNSGAGCQSVGATINTNSYHTVSQIATKAVVCSTSSSTKPSTVSSTTTLSTSSSSSASTSSSAAATGTDVGNASNTSTKSSSSGIGAGAIAGIVIGALCILAIILVCGWLLGRRSSKRKAAGSASTQPPMSNTPGYGEGNFGPQSLQKSEEPVHVQELPQPEPMPVHEMGHSEQRLVAAPGYHEVPADTTWRT